jgi:hypothetical protein
MKKKNPGLGWIRVGAVKPTEGWVGGEGDVAVNCVMDVDLGWIWEGKKGMCCE